MTLGESYQMKKPRMNKLLRRTLRPMRNVLVSLESRFDKYFLANDVPIPRRVGHQQWKRYLSEFANRPGLRVLEIGSREVTGPSDARTKLFARAEYVGFDYYPGRNVDVVGDAHKLSSYFEGQRFDLIYSSACFEHFAMPWVVAGEIAKLLKLDGLVFVETHFSFGSHERPWNFFQFSDMGLRVLFSEAMGFECVDAGLSNPIVGRFSSLADPYLQNEPVVGLYCHVEYLAKKVRDVSNFDWAAVDLAGVVGPTTYPEPTRAPGD